MTTKANTHEAGACDFTLQGIRVRVVPTLDAPACLFPTHQLLLVADMQDDGLNRAIAAWFLQTYGTE
jgi:hypothetical protein